MAWLAAGSKSVIYGQTSGAPPLLDVNRLSGITPGSARGSNRITWAASSDYTEDQGKRQGYHDAVFDLLRSGVIAPHIAARLPLAEAQEAHRLMETRQVTGKLLLIPAHEQA